MKIKLAYLGLMLFIACSHPSAIKKQLSGSDSLVVQFNVPGTDTIEKTLTATDHNAINELIGFIDSKKSETRQCRYDGNLIFYKNGNQAGDVSFNYGADSCRQFIMEMNGEYTRTKMSNKAADFLQGLKDQKSYY